MTITFTDREYRTEHDRAPRGYGCWAFSFEGHEFWATGTLTQAKKECREEIKRLAPEGYKHPVFVKILP